MEERLIERLAAISSSLNENSHNDEQFSLNSFVLATPSGETWEIIKGKEPIKYLSENKPKIKIDIKTNESLERFVNGKVNPQSECLNGDWNISGSMEEAMLLSKILSRAFELNLHRS